MAVVVLGVLDIRVGAPPLIVFLMEFDVQLSQTSRYLVSRRT